jgi:hypothetical protein
MHPGQAEGRGRREAFLAALQEGRSVTGAAMAAGINRTLLYRWRTDMPGFADAWDEAVETAADLLEDEALRRAMHGVHKPVFYRGEQVGTITTYSDRLLALLLQRRRPVAPPPRPTARPQRDDGRDLAAELAAARRRVARLDRERADVVVAAHEADAGAPPPRFIAPCTDPVQQPGDPCVPAAPVAAPMHPDAATEVAAAPRRHDAPATAEAMPERGHAPPTAAPRRRDAPVTQAASQLKAPDRVPAMVDTVSPTGDGAMCEAGDGVTPYRGTLPEALRRVPLSRLARMMPLTSAQALEALSFGPPDPDMATFGPPWGR